MAKNRKRCTHILASTGKRCKNKAVEKGSCSVHMPFLTENLKKELRKYMASKLPRRRRRRRSRKNPWPRGKSRRKYNVAKRAWKTRKRKSRNRSLAAKKAWRTRKRRYGKSGVKK